MNDEIRVGSLNSPSQRFSGAAVKDGLTALLSSSLVGDVLAIDELTATIATANGTMPGISRNSAIYWLNGGTLMGKFYTKSLTRKTRTDYELVAQSAVGVLDSQTYYGGIWPTGILFPELLSDILGSQFSFSCVSSLSTLRIYGWIPICSRRKALHQVLMASGAVIQKDNVGELYFAYLDKTSPRNVGDDRIFYGGTVDYYDAATSIELSEHGFYSLASDEEVIAYDNTNGAAANNTLVTFSDAPLHSLSADGLTIVSSGPNFARVTGIGTLTGKKYTHTITPVKLKKTGTTEDVTVTVEDATLVSLFNSQNVARRLLSYYGSGRTVKADIELSGEKTGDFLRFNDPFGDRTDAFLASMYIKSSSFLRGSCELVSNYSPVGGGNNFENTDFFTASGSWTSPIDGLVRVVLVGGGDGGQNGGNGENGSRSTINRNVSAGDSVSCEPGEGGLGGAAGIAGSGGKILVVTFTAVSGQRYNYTIGAGGNAGQAGGATTFGSYSSANGSASSTGYSDPTSGAVYGLPGADGSAGAAGGDGGRATSSAARDGEAGENTATRSGGAAGTGAYQRYYADLEQTDYSGTDSNGGGGGGGASSTAAGSAGVNGMLRRIAQPTLYFDGGAGGKGANGAAGANASGYGCGGSGGSGGGGGGGAGGLYVWAKYINYTVSYNPVLAAGGSGGSGGKGSAGCIRIYY